ncbi:TonB family protein [Saonia flava]|uniref:TonB family protein n=1 Tax=Saonia flava TaxID=523696 RepID=A0A846QWV0_9FLAO|nr:M56 family metallopeptidase [Saonia flava]NJB71062.1 TonB family protein [Saonia flava]
MIQYILECIAFQLLFLIIYDLFLKRETFFQWNRVYLMGTFILSAILPWIKIEAFKTTVPQKFIAYPEYLWGMSMQEVVLSETNTSSVFDISWEYGILYGGMLLAVVLFAYKIHQILRLRKKGEVQYFKDFTQVLVQQSKVAFSFFKTIFMGDQIKDEEYENIVLHEMVHIKQKHSLDLMFFEIMRIVGWFNPLVYVYQSRISELHEFIADAQVAKTHKKEQYQLLLSQVFQTQNISFINPFFKSSLIKKRIVMLQKQKTKRIYQLKYLALVPLILGMLFYTSATEASYTYNETTLSLNDVKLINEIKNKIKKQVEIEGSISNVYLSSKLPSRFKSEEIIKKEDFFEYKILYRQYVNELLTVTYPALGEEVPEEILKKYGNPSLPSSKLYELYKVEKDLSETVIPFAKVDEVPIFPGCENIEDKKACFNEKIHEHIRKNFNYPKEAQEKGIQGRVNVMFTISKKGEMVDFRMRGPDSLLEKEAERIISRLPKMKPGKNGGKKVGVAYSIPITFKLKGSDDEVSSAVEKYNQLLEERDRLLKTSNDKNSIIVNLDKQLLALKNRISENLTNSLSNKNIPYGTVDQVPIFPGCEDVDDKKTCFNEKMIEHIKKNFWYPKDAQTEGVQGRVNIMFTINRDGNIANIRKRGPDRRLEDVAVGIISRLPKMKPGIHHGNAVNVPYSIPITFKL